jgi:hypothetical protein
MNVIVCGIIGRYPYGGVAWCSLMYLLGLRKLGHNVWYLEDTGECNYDPEHNTISEDPAYAVRFVNACLEPYGFGGRWCYVDYRGGYHGHGRADWLRVCREADLFLNLSGGCWFWRDEYASIPHTAFIDSDPAFTQLAIDKAGRNPADAWYVDFFRRFDARFTFGRNIGTPDSPVPTARLQWEHTWQPVVMDEWAPVPPGRDCFTTVMTWRIHSFAEVGGNKDQEFLKVLDLPSRTAVPIELAVNGPQEFLRRHGWRCRDAYAVSNNLNNYRDYLRSSFGEFSVAKHTYVATRSGWFSDRTECYLAAGRPAVVQDTGFSRHVPTGAGLLAFSNADEAVAALESLTADYDCHRRSARELAAAHFSSDVVLPPLLERATAGQRVNSVVEAGQAS